MVSIFLITGLACSEKIINKNSSDNISITISARLTSTLKANELTDFLLTVTAPDIFESINASMILEHQLLFARVDIPAGTNRRFEIRVLDSSGALIYMGVAVSDVIRDQILELDIALQPTVPMIKLSPPYKSVQENSSIVMLVKAFNLDNLMSIDLTVNSSGLSYLFFDSVVAETAISNSVQITGLLADTAYQGGTSHCTFRVSGSESIVDNNGSARLVTLFFSTLSSEYPIDTASFTIEATNLLDVSGNTISPSIFYEGSEYEFYRPDYFLIAHWPMNYDSIDIMYDMTQNNLDGNVHGATLYPGDTLGYDYDWFFDGIDDYIEVPDTAGLLNIKNEITISMWFQLNILEGEGILISKRGANDQVNYQIRCEVSNIPTEETLSFEYGLAPYNIFQTRKFLRDDKWHYIRFSCIFGEPSSAYWMIDSQVVEGTWISGDGLTIPETNSGNLQIGRQLSTDPCFYYGGLDEIMIYNKALDSLNITRPTDAVGRYPYMPQCLNHF